MRTFAQRQNQRNGSEPSTLVRSIAATTGSNHHTNPILPLQRTIGNQATRRMLQTHTEEPDSELTAVASPGFAHDFSRIPVRNQDSLLFQQNVVGRPPGTPYEQAGGLIPQQVTHAFDHKKMLADWLPQTHGTTAEQAIVRPASPIADREKANAVTLGQTVHLSSGLTQLQAGEQQRILAHEAVHVAQHSAPGPVASRLALEAEARQLTPRVLAGQGVHPRLHADMTMGLADDGGPLPTDTIAVSKAKARREVLLRYKAIYEGSKSLKSNIAAERQSILDKRERLDDSMAKNLTESEKYTNTKSPDVDEYRAQEEKNLAKLNRKPITLEVTATVVRIRARFQVRFEGLPDKEAAKKFPVLKKNLEQGVRDVWNQELTGAVLPGRTFEVIPEINLVSSTAARDENFWLITVRPTDRAPIVYEKNPPVQAPQGTSVTDPKVGGGVMSLPPSQIDKPDILGHETLHLFGLVDRYVTVPTLGEFGLRNTRGRQDPLGADPDTGKVKGKILEEDLGFVLDQLGVYPKIPYNDVLAELKQVEEVIRTGRDPNSLIRKRKDFVPEMVKQAEDLD